MSETRSTTMELHLDPFEHRLLRELQIEFRDHQPFDQPNWLQQPARRMHARRWTAGVAAASVAVLGAVATWGGTPAYALSQAPGGDVVVTIHSPEDAHGLEQELEQLGIDAAVDFDADIDVISIKRLDPDWSAPPQGGAASPRDDGPRDDRPRMAPYVWVQDGDFVFTLPAELIDSTVEVHVNLSQNDGPHGDPIGSVYWVDQS